MVVIPWCLQLGQEFGRDEARDRKKTLEKARAVEKMQSELLSLEVPWRQILNGQQA